MCGGKIVRAAKIQMELNLNMNEVFLLLKNYYIIGLHLIGSIEVYFDRTYVL